MIRKQKIARYQWLQLHVLNRKYVITNCTYINENSVLNREIVSSLFWYCCRLCLAPNNQIDVRRMYHAEINLTVLATISRILLLRKAFETNTTLSFPYIKGI